VDPVAAFGAKRPARRRDPIGVKQQSRRLLQALKRSRAGGGPFGPRPVAQRVAGPTPRRLQLPRGRLAPRRITELDLGGDVDLQQWPRCSIWRKEGSCPLKRQSRCALGTGIPPDVATAVERRGSAPEDAGRIDIDLSEQLRNLASWRHVGVAMPAVVAVAPEERPLAPAGWGPLSRPPMQPVRAANMGRERAPLECSQAAAAASWSFRPAVNSMRLSA
jgi:hypothetical protein